MNQKVFWSGAPRRSMLADMMFEARSSLLVAAGVMWLSLFVLGGCLTSGSSKDEFPFFPIRFSPFVGAPSVLQ